VLADPTPPPSPRLLSSCQHTDDTKFPNHTSVGLEKLDTATNEMSRISLTYDRPKKGKGSPHSITKRSGSELIPVLGSQPAGDASHKPDGTLSLLSARPAVTLAALKRAATNFAAWLTEARWV